jgi:ferredoxin
MLEDVRGFKAACPTCQLLRKWDQEDDTLSTIPARPWVDVSIDFLMVSPTDHLGHLAILVVEDNFSGACELIPVKSVTAETLARECVKVFGRTNAPITIRSDQGPAFESLVSNALMRAMGVVQHRVLHGHLRANGIVERTNSYVVSMLRACGLDDRVVPSALVSWAELTPWIQRNINRAMSSKTRKAPVQLLYGDRVDLDRELFDPVPDNFYNGPPVKIGGYVQALIDSYDGCLQAALAQGLPWPSRCRVGSCTTCRCRLLEGDVRALTDTSYVLSREQLEQQLYSWGHEVESNAIEVHIHHLRRKLQPELIQTLRGVGYTVPRQAARRRRRRSWPPCRRRESGRRLA